MRWSSLRAIVVGTAVAVALPLTVTAAQAAEVEGVEPEPAPAAVTSAPEPDVEPEVVATVALDSAAYTGHLGTTVEVTGTVGDATDTATVRLARRDGDTWVPLPTPVERVDGVFAATVPVQDASAVLRAELLDAGEVVAASELATLTGTRARSTLNVLMTSKATDYRSVSVVTTWRTVDGRRPTGKVRLVLKPRGATAYKTYRYVTMVDGTARFTIVPRNDGRFALAFGGSRSLTAASSVSRVFDNLPPGKAVSVPKGASRPSVKLPAQSRASRPRADATISKISDAMWKSMKGRSWHSGCPVGRGSLRVVRVSYWAFDGYVRRGEIVVASKHAKATAKVFTSLFAKKAPVRSMYRVDRFGYSKKLKGADDYESMRADNTSGFNCRQVVGNSGRRSPHAYGKAVDINPWENPYASPEGWYPNGSWQKRSKPASVTYRGRNDPVVKVFRANGFRWLGGFDLQHFER